MARRARLLTGREEFDRVVAGAGGSEGGNQSFPPLKTKKNGLAEGQKKKRRFGNNGIRGTGFGGIGGV